MSTSSTGQMFVVTNFGESHGPAVGCVIDGCPPGMTLSAEDIQVDLDRRRPGTSRLVTQRNEADMVKILSGVYQGITTGTPIALVIENTDQRSKDYDKIKDTFRPAHADWGYWAKYGGIRDPGGGGRASARLTVPTVAAGAVARKWLQENLGIRIRACVTSIGEIDVGIEDWSLVDKTPFFVPNSRQISEIEAYIDSVRKSGNSVGASVYLRVSGVPAGLGDPVYNRLDGELARALMNINAVKGVEIGAGFSTSRMFGTQNADRMYRGGFQSNNAGGILGGISSGAPITAAVAIKPTPSVLQPMASVDSDGNEVEVATRGRHDPCVGLRAVPVVEAAAALVLIDAALRQRAQCGNLGLRLEDAFRDAT